MTKLWQFSQRYPRPAFSEKVQRGDQGKFFKNRPKSSPCLKNPKALWRKLNYTLIKINVKCKDWKIFWRKQRLQKCPNGHVMAIIARSPKTRIFWKSQKGRPRDIFQKSPKKQPSFERPQSNSCALFSNLYALKLQRLEKILRQTSVSKSARMAKLWQFLQRHPKAAFSKKAQTGEQLTFFKNRPKRCPP